MDNIEYLGGKVAQSGRALELQTLILYYHPKYASQPISLKRPKWDFQEAEEPGLQKLRQLAISKGFCEEDVAQRNQIIKERKEAINPIKHLHGGLIATYVTSSNYYNSPLRRHLNSVQQLASQPLTLSMEQVIEKFRRESEEAAYSWGCSLDGQISGMRLQGRLSTGFSTLLLKNLLLERKKPGKTIRGFLASSQFVTLLNYYSENETVVTIDQFLSTTTIASVAHDFARGQYDSIAASAGDKKVIFILEGNSGADISAWLDEGEVLYPPETYFQVSAASYYERICHFGAVVYKLKEVPPPANREKVPFLTDMAKLQRVT